MTALSETREYQRVREATYRQRLRLDPERLVARQQKQKEWRDSNPVRKKKYESAKAQVRRQKRPWAIAFRSARRRAQKHGLLFELTYDWAKKQFEAGSPLSGLPFKNEVGPFSPSIDRLDSSKGYTFGNSRMILHAENLFKNCWNDDVVILIARGIVSRCA